MPSTRKIPLAGEGLSLEDVGMIIKSIEARRNNFPDEDEAQCIAIVLFNIGDKYAPVSCVGREWSGYKIDLSPKNVTDLPKCPNGHVLVQGNGLRLGWLDGG